MIPIIQKIKDLEQIQRGVAIALKDAAGELGALAAFQPGDTIEWTVYHYKRGKLEPVQVRGIVESAEGWVDYKDQPHFRWKVQRLLKDNKLGKTVDVLDIYEPHLVEG